MEPAVELANRAQCTAAIVPIDAVVADEQKSAAAVAPTVASSATRQDDGCSEAASGPVIIDCTAGWCDTTESDFSSCELWTRSVAEWSMELRRDRSEPCRVRVVGDTSRVVVVAVEASGAGATRIDACIEPQLSEGNCAIRIGPTVQLRGKKKK